MSERVDNNMSDLPYGRNQKEHKLITQWLQGNQPKQYSGSDSTNSVNVKSRNSFDSTVEGQLIS